MKHPIEMPASWCSHQLPHFCSICLQGPDAVKKARRRQDKSNKRVKIVGGLMLAVLLASLLWGVAALVKADPFPCSTDMDCYEKFGEEGVRK